MFSRRVGVIAITGGCAVAILAGGFLLIGSGDAADSHAATPPTTAHRIAHKFSATMRNKTFTIDERAYTTGKGDVSAVGLVDARVDGDPIRHGARVAFGQFTGSPLSWTLDERMYFDDGTVKTS